MGNQDDKKRGHYVAGKWKSWLWKIFTLPLLGVVYIVLISDGLRYLIPVLGMRLYKLPVPGFSALRTYQATFRLDVAHVLSLCMLIAVWMMWNKNLRFLLLERDPVEDSGWKADATRRFVMGLSVLILGADSCLFYVSMSHQDWGEAAFSFPALLATLAYVGVVVFVSFVSVNLEKPWKED